MRKSTFILKLLKSIIIIMFLTIILVIVLRVK